MKVGAADKAGNSAEKEVKFQITTDIDAIQNNVSHYFDLGLIKKKIARKYLMTKLKHLEKLFDLLEKAENSKLKPKPKQATVNALKKIINASIGLGEAIANLIYWAILIIAVAGSAIFLAARKKFLALIWFSAFINLFYFLYFLGARNLSTFLINYIIWPILNIFLITWYFKTKAKK